LPIPLINLQEQVVDFHENQEEGNDDEPLEDQSILENNDDQEPDEVPNVVLESIRGSSHCFVSVYTVLMLDNTLLCDFEEKWLGTACSNLNYDDGILNAVIAGTGISNLVGTHELHFITEYHRDNTTYRSHPDYRKGGPWMDWVNVRWEGDEEEEDGGGETPSQILCFFYCLTSEEPEKLFALVQPCEFGSDELSSLVTAWNLEKGYQIVSVDSLQHHVCIFPYRDGDRKRLQLRDKCVWANEFIGEDGIGPFEEFDEVAEVHWM
jgi:hypothetical protein